MADQSDNHDSDHKPDEETPPMNLFEAIGVALFKSVDDSKINRPGQGTLKRSFRLTRLLIVMALAVVSFVIVIAMLAQPMAGWLKLLGVIIFLAFTCRCVYVSVQLWRKLQ